MLNTMSMTLLNRNVFNSTYYLQKNCGLDFYTTPLIDKLGKKSRDAERALALVGDKVTYATLDLVQESALWDVEFEIFITASTNQFIFDCRKNGGIGWAYFSAPALWATSSGIRTNIGNKYKITDITLSITDFIAIGANSTLGLALTDALISLKLTNKSTGLTYTLVTNERQSTGLIPFNITDASGKAVGILNAQQMLSPATPTVETLAVKSDFDKYGGTIAKATGKNLINFKLIKSAYETTVTTITNGININGTYYGSVHINLNVGETYVMDWDTEIISGSPQNAWRIEYIDGTYSLITSKGVSILIEKEVKNVYLYVNLGTSTEANYTNIQLELGTVPTAYVLWEGYHLDELCTIPAEDGTPISADRYGTLFAWVKDEI